MKLINAIVLCFEIFLFLSCNKLDIDREAEIYIGEIQKENLNTYTVSAQIVDVGDGIEDYGHCWGKKQNPSIIDEHTTNGEAHNPQIFTSRINNLEPNTHYFVRAYITAGNKYYYSKELTISTTNFGLPVINLIIDSILGNSIGFTYNVIQSGEYPIEKRGVCWSDFPNPTFESSNIQHEGGSGLISDYINNLNRLSKYYIRAFSTTELGTEYSEQIIVETSSEPAVIQLLNISNITSNSAQFESKIIDTGGGEIISKGYCWSTLSEPTIEGDFIILDKEDLNFSSKISGLEEITKYYVRAYVTNEIVTSYSNEIEFRTQSSSNSFVDVRDGQSYSIVQVGEQWWMAENLNFFTSSGSAYYNDDSLTYSQIYGRLYEWGTAVNNSEPTGNNPDFIQGVCPTSWHVPNIEEWTELANNLGGASAGGKMKATGTEYWNSPNEGATNESGLSVLPAGSKNMSGDFEELGNTASFWTATETAEFTAGFVALYSSTSRVFIYPEGTKFFYVSIRCVKD